MKITKSVFRTNVIYGVLVLAPLAVIVLLLVKIVEILHAIAEPLHLHSATSTLGALILALLLVLIICFIVGAIVRTRIGTWSFERFERTVLYQIPGFKIISTALKGFAEKKTAYRAALVQLYGVGFCNGRKRQRQPDYFHTIGSHFDNGQLARGRSRTGHYARCQQR